MTKNSHLSGEILNIPGTLDSSEAYSTRPIRQQTYLTSTTCLIHMHIYGNQKELMNLYLIRVQQRCIVVVTYPIHVTADQDFQPRLHLYKCL